MNEIMRDHNIMTETFLIFMGAGIGGVLRYWVSSSIYFLLGRQFPYGTLVVNVSGCFLMGLLFVLTLERFDSMASEMRALLLIGLLGGYTTFSSFSIETILLFENGNGISAIMNVLISVLVCILATWVGVLGGRHL